MIFIDDTYNHLDEPIAEQIRWEQSEHVLRLLRDLHGFLEAGLRHAHGRQHEGERIHVLLIVDCIMLLCLKVNCDTTVQTDGKGTLSMS